MKQRFMPLLASALTLAILGASGHSLAQSAPAAAVKPETLIKTRQSAFQLTAFNSGRIKAALDGQYNREEVIKAANTIAAVANSGLGALFAPGTEQGKGWHDTTARPELFKDPKHFSELGAAFGKEATTLASIAAGGDPVAVKEQYARLTRTCKACHDDYKNKE